MLLRHQNRQLHSLCLGRIGGYAHHFAVAGRLQDIGFAQMIAGMKVAAGGHACQFSGIGTEKLFPYVGGVEHRHIDHLQALQIRHPEALANLHGHRNTGCRRQFLIKDGTNRTLAIYGLQRDGTQSSAQFSSIIGKLEPRAA